MLRLQTIAFRGTLTTLDPAAGTATFEVTEWFQGGPTDLARVTTPPTTSTSSIGLDGAAGRPYLVAARAGLVTGCGFTGPDTPVRSAL